MTDLRREAIGRACQIRLDGCTNRPCCLCHFRVLGVSGMGMKSPDLIGAWGCDHCHNLVDLADEDDFQTRYFFLRGVVRTQAILIKEGLVSW